MSGAHDTVQATQDDVNFWSQRLREHALFLYLLLDEQKVPELKEEAYRQLAQWSQLVSATEVPYEDALRANLLALKQEILARVNAGEAINLEIPPDAFASLVQHMIKEITFFRRLVAGQVTAQEEIAFWAEENAEHTELSAQLLPPGLIKDETQQLADMLRVAPLDQLQEVVEVANDSAVRLDHLINTGQLPPVMDTMMLEHEIREAERGEERLRLLLGP